jgi:hypothetical protein
VATDGLLLVSVTLVVDVATADSDTVPCAVPPMAMLDAFSATDDIASDDVGAAGVLEPPHRLADIVARAIQAKATADWRRRVVIESSSARTGPLTAAMVEVVCLTDRVICRGRTAAP